MRSFREKCISAYEKAEKERKEAAQKRADEFREAAVREFEKRFSVSVTKSKAVSDYQAELVIQDVNIVARNEGTGIRFFTLRKCNSCDTYFLPRYPNSCETLEDIGRDLTIPVTCGHCRSVMNYLNTKSPGEQVIEKLREILDIVGYSAEGV